MYQNFNQLKNCIQEKVKYNALLKWIYTDNAFSNNLSIKTTQKYNTSSFINFY